MLSAGKRRRKPRQEISFGVKKQIIRLRDAKVPWAVVLRQLPVPVNKRNAKKIMAEAAVYRTMPDDARTLYRNKHREGKWPELNALVCKWYLAFYALGHRRKPITTALLQEAATMTAGRLDTTGVSAIHGWIRGFLKRFDICNVAMHGQAGAVNLVAAAATYVPRKDRRRARGTKAMWHMDRVTLVLCTNATGTHKVPVAMIGEAAKPLCFRGDENSCPLPYLDQRRAWIDKLVYARWRNTVFLPAVRERHRGAKCGLIMKNSSTHDVELMAYDVDTFYLPPNTTAVYQPMDAGMIAALERRYKRRLLAILVQRFPVPLAPPPPPDPTNCLDLLPLPSAPPRQPH